MQMDEGNFNFLFVLLLQKNFYCNNYYFILQVNDFLKHSDVHENNRLIAKKMLEFFKHKIGIIVEHNRHSITNKPICIYSVSKINNI